MPHKALTPEGLGNFPKKSSTLRAVLDHFRRVPAEDDKNRSQEKHQEEPTPPSRSSTIKANPEARRSPTSLVRLGESDQCSPGDSQGMSHPDMSCLLPVSARVSVRPNSTLHQWSSNRQTTIPNER
uniref:Rho-GAP domain-containing protein n=1 Tax=Steinernema glaseri TaxID=37863 RepID=A0A1I7ZL04_9BILA